MVVPLGTFAEVIADNDTPEPVALKLHVLVSGSMARVTWVCVAFVHPLKAVAPSHIISLLKEALYGKPLTKNSPEAVVCVIPNEVDIQNEA
jgi:hypothetical protein